MSHYHRVPTLAEMFGNGFAGKLIDHDQVELVRKRIANDPALRCANKYKAMPKATTKNSQWPKIGLINKNHDRQGVGNRFLLHT